MLHASGETKQDVTLGVDAGSKTIGLSATTEKKEVNAGISYKKVKVLEQRKTILIERRKGNSSPA